jgi:hypothetical protein
MVPGLDPQGVNPIQAPAVPRPPARVPIWIWVLVFVVVAPFAGCFSLLGYAAVMGPDLEAKPGSQTPKRFIRTIRARGLLAPTETPTYFFSDGFTDIEDGMYFFTDRKLVAYSSEWDPPAVVVPLTDITQLDLTRSTSWLDDSTIAVQYGGGGFLEIPVSAEKDGDLRFYQALESAWKKSKP